MARCEGYEQNGKYGQGIKLRHLVDFSMPYMRRLCHRHIHDNLPQSPVQEFAELFLQSQYYFLR